MRFLTSGFFHESIVPGPWIHMLKYFSFHGDIHEVRFFCSDFRGTIPGNQLISGFCYPEKNWFLSNNTWKSIYSGYCDPEINWFPGNDTQTFSKKTTFVNIPWNLGKNQQIYSEIFSTFPGIVTRKLSDFRETLPGNQLISGYCARKVKICDKNSEFFIFKQLYHL